VTDPSTELVGDFIDAVVDDEARARDLLAASPELLNARWHLGETALHFLAVEGSVEGVRRLAEWGADVNLSNRLGDPPLLDCVVLRNEPLVELLLRYGANPNVASDTLGPVLHAAAASGHAGVVRRLLCAGADPRARSEWGDTVFDAARHAHPDDRPAVLAVLAELGITPHAG
jgi:ankyrin repeat protein